MVVLAQLLLLRHYRPPLQSEILWFLEMPHWDCAREYYGWHDTSWISWLYLRYTKTAQHWWWSRQEGLFQRGRGAQGCLKWRPSASTSWICGDCRRSCCNCCNGILWYCRAKASTQSIMVMNHIDHRPPKSGKTDGKSYVSMQPGRCDKGSASPVLGCCCLSCCAQHVDYCIRSSK